jgi:hypothetical protein
MPGDVQRGLHSSMVGVPRKTPGAVPS